MSDSSYEVKVSFAIRLVNRSHISLIMYHVIYMISDTLACSPTFCASARLIKDQTWFRGGLHFSHQSTFLNCNHQSKVEIFAKLLLFQLILWSYFQSGVLN